MAESSKKGRKRGSVPIEPIVFEQLTESFMEQIKKRESYLRAAGMWDFVTDLEIPWPWPADLSEFFLSACASEFQHLVVRKQPVRFDTEAITQVTTLPGEDSVSIAEACRAIDAPEWGVVFENGQSAFDTKRRGWDLQKALPPWRDWLLLVQQQIELGREGEFMEHCVVCAALAAWIRGTKFNWAEEVKSRIKEEIETYQLLRPLPLKSAGYIGLLCQLSFGSEDTSASRRKVTPFLSKPIGFVREELVLRPDSPLLSPEPPVILEESVELHGNSPARRESEPFCLLWKETSSPRSALHVKALEERLGKVLEELEVQKGLVKTQQIELDAVKGEMSRMEVENSKLTKMTQTMSERRQQAEKESREWQTKCDEAVSLTGQLLKEKEAWEKSKNDMAAEKAEWLSLKERQEQAITAKSAKIKSLQGQVNSLLTDESNIINLQHQVNSLRSLGDTQSAVIDTLRQRVERLKSGIWAIESICPPFHSLFKNYELQRDIFFLAYSLRQSQVLDPVEFEKLWEEVTADGRENLLTEILVRGELRLHDLFKGFQAIADLGVHIFLYYCELELSLSTKRRLVANVEASQPNRQIDIHYWTKAVNSALAVCPPLLMQPWHTELTRLRSSLGNDEYLQAVMDAATERLAIAKHLDVGAGQYQLKFDQMIERLERSLQAIAKPSGRVQVHLQNQVTFFLPPSHLVQRTLRTARRRPPVSLLANQFLGNYAALFDSDIEEPIPSWKAFDWIFEDVGLSRQISTRPEDAHDVVYRRICHGWSPTPLVTVTNDPRFCDCPRRLKWPPQALLDSLEYNWPVIPGTFLTAQDCHESYMRFSYEHREHQDPVCFRAAIFTAILGFWCKKYDFTYNVNLLSKANREAMFLTKINYNSARWYRCLEAMCATYFIIGPHHSMVNEFGVTRYGVISRALKSQRLTHNTVVPQEEVMAPGYVEEYGPSSQRPFKPMDHSSKRSKR